mmetsp:Transcript_2374/g.5471  ORF Transcript_2374/g.5471 Transcript_2374/m.5471 type:complete len:225 (-) Transcript_2374:575-1249(-)
MLGARPGLVGPLVQRLVGAESLVGSARDHALAVFLVHAVALHAPLLAALRMDAVRPSVVVLLVGRLATLLDPLVLLHNWPDVPRGRHPAWRAQPQRRAVPVLGRRVRDLRTWVAAAHAAGVLVIPLVALQAWASAAAGVHAVLVLLGAALGHPVRHGVVAPVRRTRRAAPKSLAFPEVVSLIRVGWISAPNAKVLALSRVLVLREALLSRLLAATRNEAALPRR